MFVLIYSIYSVLFSFFLYITHLWIGWVLYSLLNIVKSCHFTDGSILLLTQVLSLSHIIFRFLYRYSQQRAIPMVLLKMHRIIPAAKTWPLAYICLAHMCFLCVILFHSHFPCFLRGFFFYTVSSRVSLVFGPQNHLCIPNKLLLTGQLALESCSLLLCLRSSGSFRTFVNSRWLQ